MNKTPNKDYNLINYEDGNSDTIKDSLDAFNNNFSKIDTDITSVENDVDNMAEDFGEVITDIRDNITALADNYKPNTANGKNIHLTDSASAPIKEIQIGDGEIEQEEEPTPDSPQDVNVVKGECTVQASNKNLFDATIVNNYESHSVISNGNADGTITVQGVTAYTSFNITPTTIVNYPAGKYVFSLKEPLDTNLKIDTKSQEGEHYYVVFNNGLTKQVHDFPNGINSIRVYKDSLTVGDEFDFSFNLQTEKVESGTAKASEFVPHKGKTYPLTLPTGMFLGSIGTAKNYIHGTKNNWKFHKDLGKVVLNGSESWTQGTTVTEGLYRWQLDLSDIKILASSSTIPNLRSNLYKPVSAGSGHGTYNNEEGISVQDGRHRIMIYDSTYNTSVDEFKSMLVTKNLELYYEVQDTTDETITDETLINQLNALSEMQTYSEQTIIYSVTENLEPTLKIKYRVDPFIEINNRLDALEARVTLLEG